MFYINVKLFHYIIIQRLSDVRVHFKVIKMLTEGGIKHVYGNRDGMPHSCLRVGYHSNAQVLNLTGVCLLTFSGLPE